MSDGESLLPEDPDTHVGLGETISLAVWVMLAYNATVDEVCALKCRDIDLMRKKIRMGPDEFPLYDEALNARLAEHLDLTLSIQMPFAAVVDEWGPELIGQIDPEIPLFWRPPSWTSMRGNIERALARIAELNPQRGASK